MAEKRPSLFNSAVYRRFMAEHESSDVGLIKRAVCLFVCLLSALAIPTPASQRSFTCMCFPRVPQKVVVNVSPSIARYL